MFWTGFWCGILTILVIETIVIAITFILAYKGAPLAEDDE